MEEQSARGPETARQGQESGGRRSPSPPARAREAAAEGARVAGQIAGIGSETFAVWCDVSQRSLRDVLELSAQATQEGARQVAGWQQMQVDILREMQGATMRWISAWPEAARDPIRGYQRMLEESLEATQRTFELTRRQAETLTQGCQRLERAADDATKTLNETFREATARIQAQADRLRAA